MGTPQIAVSCLKSMIEQGCNIVGVVSTPDKPSGRGLKINQAPVAQFARENHIPTLTPEKLSDENFHKELESLKPDIQVVVAFKKLPKAVWALPPLGTMNLHASLLPDYRGAAPINWAIINGESKTGLTTFMIEENIDTGDLLLQKEIALGENTTAGELHDEMSRLGGDLIVNTIQGLAQGSLKPVPQSAPELIKKAPKIFKEDCKIDWSQSALEIHNKVRGLSPYPGAFTIANIKGQWKQVKVLRTEITDFNDNKNPFQMKLESGKGVFVSTNLGVISIKELQIEGKKAMTAQKFINGNQEKVIEIQ